MNGELVGLQASAVQQIINQNGFTSQTTKSRGKIINEARNVELGDLLSAVDTTLCCCNGCRSGSRGGGVGRKRQAEGVRIGRAGAR